MRLEVVAAVVVDMPEQRQATSVARDIIGSFTSRFSEVIKTGRVPPKVSCLEDLYDTGELIGEGAFSKVVTVKEKPRSGRSELARRPTLACKVLKLPKNNGKPADGQTTRAEALHELELLRTLDHPNLVKLHDYIVTDTTVNLIMGLSRGGDVQTAVDYRGSLAEEDARGIMKGVFSAIAHMHALGVAHRDLKLENVLILEENDTTAIQVADLGLAKKLQPECPHTICGSPAFLAPEVIDPIAKHKEKGDKANYCIKVDLWSCGVMLYYMLSGHPPFSGATVFDLMCNICSGNYSFNDPAWHMVSDDAKDLIYRLLQLDPSARPTAEEALKHKWMSEHP